MDPLRNLLVPVDLTSHSDRVLGRLSRLPLAEDATVTLLHVVPGGLPFREQESAERDASKLLADEVQHLQAQLASGATVASLVKVGAAAKEIAATAVELGVELIVMGRGGGRALRDAFVGSTAERVVRQSQLPVLVVRRAPRAVYQRPALALDLDQAAHEVVRLMLQVLSSPRPRVEVIHAFDVPYQGFIYPSLPDELAQERKAARSASAVREVDELLAAGLAAAKVSSADAPPFLTHVEYGPARTVVEKAIKRAGADLLILGTHGYSGAAYVFLGTVAGDLLRMAKCDVLVVPPGSAPA